LPKRQSLNVDRAARDIFVIMIRTENRRSTSQAASCAALMRRLGDSQWDAPGFPFPQIAPGDQERRGVESLVLVGYGPVSGSNLTLATRSAGVGSRGLSPRSIG